jgi:very-short-patch-repair endonuclease
MGDRQKMFAQKMRAEPTDAERVLWQRLRHDIRLIGSHFRRQAVIGAFIVDFASRRAKLVIELDGGQHDWQRDWDLSRSQKIEAAGYRILRFWNNDVLGNIEGVLDEIQRAGPPPPTPPRKGEGRRESSACRAKLVNRERLDADHSLIIAQNHARQKTHFASRFKQITPAEPPRRKFRLSLYRNLWLSSRRPVSIRGALRGRHGR